MSKLINSEDFNRDELRVNEDIIQVIPVLKVRIRNSKGIPIKNFSELWTDRENNRIDIILNYFVKDPKREIKEEDGSVVTFRLTSRSSKDRYLECKKKALVENIRDKILSAVSTFNVTENENNLTTVECQISKPPVDSNGRIVDEIIVNARANTTSNEIITFSYRNIEMVPNFYLPIRCDEEITFPSPQEKPKPFWTSSKLTIAVLAIGIITALVYFYRKKIWAWIKGEDKSKKKEQVEIF